MPYVEITWVAGRTPEMKRKNRRTDHRGPD
jgi:hypothetical protein